MFPTVFFKFMESATDFFAQKNSPKTFLISKFDLHMNLGMYNSGRNHACTSKSASYLFNFEINTKQ